MRRSLLLQPPSRVAAPWPVRVLLSETGREWCSVAGPMCGCGGGGEVAHVQCEYQFSFSQSLKIDLSLVVILCVNFWCQKWYFVRIVVFELTPEFAHVTQIDCVLLRFNGHRKYKHVPIGHTDHNQHHCTGSRWWKCASLLMFFRPTSVCVCTCVCTWVWREWLGGVKRCANSDAESMKEEGEREHPQTHTNKEERERGEWRGNPCEAS